MSPDLDRGDGRETVPRDEFREWVIASRARQGLPPTVTDPATLERIADLMQIPAAKPPENQEE